LVLTAPNWIIHFAAHILGSEDLTGILCVDALIAIHALGEASIETGLPYAIPRMTILEPAVQYIVPKRKKTVLKR